MFQSEHLQEKWAPLLDYEGLDPIKDSHRKAVTAVLLENQEKFLREEQQFGSGLSLMEATPTNHANVAGAQGGFGSAGTNALGNAGLVVGATQAEALSGIREVAPNMPLLIPGVGAQGGDLETVIQEGTDSNGRGLLINSSRDILYASTGLDFAEAARQATIELRDKINKLIP